jgi:hypothetical protein
MDEETYYAIEKRVEVCLTTHLPPRVPYLAVKVKETQVRIFYWVVVYD